MKCEIVQSREGTVLLRKEHESVVLRNDSNVVLKNEATVVCTRNSGVVLRQDMNVVLRRGLSILTICMMIVLSLHTITAVNCYTMEYEGEYEFSSKMPVEYENNVFNHVSSMVPLSEMSGLDSYRQTSPVTMEPSICHNLSCPRFHIVKSFPEEQFEMREYLPTRWVSTEVVIHQMNSNEFEEAEITALERLRRFFSGVNTERMVLEMTAPVLHEVRGNMNRDGKVVMRVSTFVPHGIRIPQPLDRKIHISFAEKKNIAVLGFHQPIYGMADVMRRAEELEMIMRRHGLPCLDVHKRELVLASYKLVVDTHPKKHMFHEIWIEIPEERVFGLSGNQFPMESRYGHFGHRELRGFQPSVL